MASKSTSHPHPSLQQLLGDGGDREKRDLGTGGTATGRWVLAQCWVPQMHQAAAVAGSAVSVRVLCSGGVARRGGERVPSHCKHGTWRASSLYPSELSEARLQRGPGFGTRRESLFVPAEQEAVEEVDGTLAVLLALPGHQVGRRAQEEAGEQGGDHGGTDVVVLRVPEQLPQEGH